MKSPCSGARRGDSASAVQAAGGRRGQAAGTGRCAVNKREGEGLWPHMLGTASLIMTAVFPRETRHGTARVSAAPGLQCVQGMVLWLRCEARPALHGSA